MLRTEMHGHRCMPNLTFAVTAVKRHRGGGLNLIVGGKHENV